MTGRFWRRSRGLRAGPNSALERVPVAVGRRPSGWMRLGELASAQPQDDWTEERTSSHRHRPRAQRPPDVRRWWSGAAEPGSECVSDDFAGVGVVGVGACFEGLLEIWVDPDGDDAGGGGADRPAAAFAAQGSGVVAGFGFVGGGPGGLVGGGGAAGGPGRGG